MKIRKGDQVIVTIGKDKGRKGKVDRVFPGNGTVLVQGVNIYKRHEKKRDEKRPGGIIELAQPLSVGKVAIICPKCAKPTRVGFIVTKALSAGRQREKARICKKCEARI